MGIFVLPCHVGILSEHDVVDFRNGFVFNAVVSDSSVLDAFNHGKQHHGLRNFLDASTSDASHSHSLYLTGESLVCNIVIDACGANVEFVCIRVVHSCLFCFIVTSKVTVSWCDRQANGRKNVLNKSVVPHIFPFSWMSNQKNMMLVLKIVEK